MMATGVLGWLRNATRSCFYAAVLLVSAAPNEALANDPPPPHAIILAWDASTLPSLAGYRLYCGAASRNYTNSVDAGTTTSVNLTNLAPGMTYYFSATV